MKSHIVISTNVERTFVCIWNLFFLIILFIILWEFHTMYFNSFTHIPTHSRSAFTSSPTHFHVLPFKKKTVESDFCCPTTLGCGACPVPRDTPLKQNDSPFPSNYQAPIPPQLGMRFHAHLQSPTTLLFWVCKGLMHAVVVAGSSICAIFLWGLENTVFLTSST